MIKILIVEAFTAFRIDLAEVLSLEGYIVVQAASGWAGLQLACKHLPDLILTAVLIPDINGYELYARLRAQPETASIPVIFITTGSLPPPAELVLTQLNFLRKPFWVLDLLKLIRDRLDAPTSSADASSAVP
jgi:CheY-like chemotaxis protein